MDALKLEHFKKLLLSELRRHARQVSDEQGNALGIALDDAKESADLSLRDVISELSLKLGERESQMIADIDQALLRIVIATGDSLSIDLSMSAIDPCLDVARPAVVSEDSSASAATRIMCWSIRA